MLSFNEVFRPTDKVLLRMLEKIMKEVGYEIVKNKRFLYAHRSDAIPVIMVAHLDTVHHSMPKDIFWDKNQNVLWSPEGLGADDRAGVWGILELIRRGHFPNVLFTMDEEIGGIGAKIAAELIKPEGVKFVIELDRKGSKDAVFYDCENPEFTKYVEGFGFKEEWGSFSDISYLCPKWGIAGVNLSTGYYDAHFKTEYLKVAELIDVLGKVESIFANLPEEPFIYIESEFSYVKAATYYPVSPRFLYPEESLCKCCGFIATKAEVDSRGYCSYCQKSFPIKTSAEGVAKPLNKRERKAARKAIVNEMFPIIKKEVN